MNILLIIYNDIETPNVFKDRINALGDTFYIFENIVFVETENSTREVYEKISQNEYERSQMLVLYVKNEMLGFWGRMKTQFWTWLSEREEKTRDGLNQSYIKEVAILNSQKKELENQQKEYLDEIKAYKEIIQNQYQQIQMLHEQLKKSGS